MSIATRIEAIEGHITNDYQGLANIGVDLTNVDKNIENIANVLADVYDEMPKVTGEGTNLTLNNTKAGKMELTYKGNTTQETTTQGNQLIPFYDQDFTINGIRFYVENGSLYTNGTSTDYVSSANQKFKDNFNITLPAGTYYFSKGNIGTAYVYKLDGTALATNNGSFTLNETTAIYVGYYIGINVTRDNVLCNSMLSVGSSSQTYEPFVPNSPSPNYPQDIHVVSGDNTIEICGKNRLDLSQVQIGIAWNNNSNSARAVCYVKVKPNTKYTISYNNISTFDGVYNFEKTNKTDSVATSSVSEITGTKTITTTATSNYLGLQFNKTSISTNDFTGLQMQIEESDEPTTYEAYTGQSQLISLGVENLFDKENISELNAYLDTTNNKIVNYSGNKSIYIACKPNTTYTISKTPSKRFGVAYTYTTPANNVAIYGTITNYDGASITITTDTNAQYLIVWVINSNISGEISYQTAIDTLQIEKGSKANSYSPYGTTPIELNKISTYQDFIRKGTGKNLFNKDNTNVFNGYWSSDTLIAQANSYGVYIAIQPNTTYTISKHEGKTFRVATTIDTPANNVSTLSSSANHTGTSITITTEATAKYLWVNYYGNTDTYGQSDMLASIQIEKSSTQTSFEPYGFKDKWYLHKEIGKKVLDGSENWVYSSSWSKTNTNVFYCSPVSNTYYPSEWFVYWLTDYFIGCTRSYLYANDVDGFSFSGLVGSLTAPFTIRIDKTIASDVTNFKSWLSTHNTTVYYVLETSTDTEITDSTLLSQLETIKKSYDGITNISQDNNDEPFILDVSALLDANTYIDHLEAQVEALS